MVGLDARRVRWSAVPQATGLRVALKWMRGLNERQVKAMEYVAKQGRITNKEYQALFGVARGTALIDLNDLVTKGLLVARGAGRGKHYVLGTARNAQCD